MTPEPQLATSADFEECRRRCSVVRLEEPTSLFSPFEQDTIRLRCIHDLLCPVLLKIGTGEWRKRAFQARKKAGLIYE